MKYKVAVVVPAYNCRSYLDRAVQSLLDQSLKELEVVIVDDGSSDGTAELADELASTHERVKVFHKENGGGYEARLYGMSRINAQFVGFLDADDYVAPMMYEEMLELAIANDLDAVQCDIKGLTDGGCGYELVIGRLQIYDKIVKPYIVDGVSLISFCDKLLRVPTGGFTFEPSNIMSYDDLVFNMQLFLHINRFAYLHKPFYSYNINSGSSVRNFSSRSVADFKKAIRFRLKYLPRYEVEGLDIANRRWIDRNLRNMFITASSARCESWDTRLRNVRLLFSAVGYPLPRFIYVRILFYYIGKRVQLFIQTFKSHISEKSYNCRRCKERRVRLP